MRHLQMKLNMKLVTIRDEFFSFFSGDIDHTASDPSLGNAEESQPPASISQTTQSNTSSTNKRKKNK